MGRFPCSDKESDRKQTEDVMFRLSLVFLLVLLTELDAPGKEVVLLSVRRDVRGSSACVDGVLGVKVVEKKEFLILASALRHD